MKKRKLTQKDQVISAMKKIGGKGTLANICDTLKNSGIKIIRANISSILSYGKEFRKDKKNDKVWVYDSNKSSQNSIIKKNVDNAIENNLYLITINDCIKQPFVGLPFKVGKSENELKERLKGYNQSLPFDTIRFICNYTIQLPKGVSLLKVETGVINELKKLTKNDYLGLGIIKIHGGNQRDWFSARNLRPDNKEHLDQLAMAIDKIIENVISKLNG